MSAPAQSPYDVLSTTGPTPASDQPQQSPWDVVGTQQPGTQPSSQPSPFDVTGTQPTPAPPQNPFDTSLQTTLTEEKPKSFMDFLANQAPNSLKNLFTNMLGAADHPIKTAEGFARIVGGDFRYLGRAAGLDLPENEYDDAAQAFGKYFYDRYGSWDKVGNTLYHDPVGSLMDASTALTGAGGVVGAAGAAADVMGATRASAVLGTMGRGLATAGEYANPVSWGTKPIPIAGRAAAAVGASPTWNKISNALAGTGLTGAMLEAATHHLYGALGYGLTAGAIKYLPRFLNSPVGRQVMSGITQGTARMGSLVPALNTFARNYEASMSQKSVIGQAKGGAVDPELARIQRARLGRRGILRTLAKRK